MIDFATLDDLNRIVGAIEGRTPRSEPTVIDDN
jgi:hypothetical protein